MKTSIKTVGIGTVAMLALTTLTASAQNLLTDPNFDLGITAPNPNPNGVPGWASFGGATFLPSGLALSGPNVLYTPDNGGGYSVPGSYQVFAATPGETFTFSGYIYTPNVLTPNGNDFAILQLSFFTGAPPNNYAGGTGTGTFGVNVGQPAGGGGVPLPQGTWTIASITGTAPAGTASLGAYILDINADPTADFYFDNMSLTVAPEPSTLALLGIGLAVPFFARRRK
jgi:PEP-CTERM motif